MHARAYIAVRWSEEPSGSRKNALLSMLLPGPTQPPVCFKELVWVGRCPPRYALDRRAGSLRLRRDNLVKTLQFHQHKHKVQRENATRVTIKEKRKKERARGRGRARKKEIQKE